MNPRLTIGFTATAGIYAALAIIEQSLGYLGVTLVFLSMAYIWHRWA